MIDLHTSLEIHDFAFKGHIYSQTIRPHFNFGFPNFSCLLAYRSASTVKPDRYVCILKNNCCIFGMVKIIIRYNFALPLHYYIDEESCSNLPSKPISTWGTSIPNIFFQGIICVCKYNGKSVLEKKMFNCIFMAKVRL